MTKLTARFVLSSRPSNDTVVGVVLIEDNKPIRCLIQSRVLNDFGTLGLKRGLNGTSPDIRLGDEIKSSNILKSLETIAVKYHADCRVHDL